MAKIIHYKAILIKEPQLCINRRRTIITKGCFERDDIPQFIVKSYGQSVDDYNLDFEIVKSSIRTNEQKTEYWISYRYSDYDHWTGKSDRIKKCKMIRKKRKISFFKSVVNTKRILSFMKNSLPKIW